MHAHEGVVQLMGGAHAQGSGRTQPRRESRTREQDAGCYLLARVQGNMNRERADAWPEGRGRGCIERATTLGGHTGRGV